MQVLDPIPAEDGTRRRFVRRLTGAGAALFTGLATLSADDAEAYPYRCCTLASDTHCSGCANAAPNGSYSCPSGYHKVQWTCCGDSGKINGCGECVPSANNSCYKGPFACSCGWWFGTYC